MYYAILRTEKIKSKSDVSRALKHCFREQKTDNADPARTPENSSFHAGSVAQGLDRFDKILAEAQAGKKKIRSDAVLAVEYLVTASPDSMRLMSHDQQDRYLKKSLAWIEEKHGKENVIAASIHRDEATPHLSVFVVPRDKAGKLSCRSFLGGAEKMSKLQDDFHAEVAEPFALDRGIKGSKARHQDVKKFYGTVINKLKPIPHLKENPGDFLVGKPGFLASKKKQEEYDLAVKAYIKKKDEYDESLRIRRAERAEMSDKYEKVALSSELLKPEIERLRKENARLLETSKANRNTIKNLSERVKSSNETIALFSPGEIEKKQQEKAEKLKAEEIAKADAEARAKAQSMAQAQAQALAALAEAEAERDRDRKDYNSPSPGPGMDCER